jgi:hypothetical protein
LRFLDLVSHVFDDGISSFPVVASDCIRYTIGPPPCYCSTSNASYYSAKNRNGNQRLPDRGTRCGPAQACCGTRRGPLDIFASIEAILGLKPCTNHSPNTAKGFELAGGRKILSNIVEGVSSRVGRRVYSASRRASKARKAAPNARRLLPWTTPHASWLLSVKSARHLHSLHKAAQLGSGELI